MAARASRAHHLRQRGDGTVSDGTGVPPPATSSQASSPSPPPGRSTRARHRQTAAGDFLYATDFHNGRALLFDSGFAPVVIRARSSIPIFPQPMLVRHPDPGRRHYVTYALRTRTGRRCPGHGHGFVNAFDTEGTCSAVWHRGARSTPVGTCARAARFREVSATTAQRQLCDGRIHAYDAHQPEKQGKLKHLGVLLSADGPPLEIEGLWAFAFGNGARPDRRHALLHGRSPPTRSTCRLVSLVLTDTQGPSRRRRSRWRRPVALEPAARAQTIRTTPPGCDADARFYRLRSTADTVRA